jgi:hypothetical protein
VVVGAAVVVGAGRGFAVVVVVGAGFAVVGAALGAAVVGGGATVVVVGTTTVDGVADTRNSGPVSATSALAPAATAVPEPPSRSGNSAGSSASVMTMLVNSHARRNAIDKGPLLLGVRPSDPSNLGGA